MPTPTIRHLAVAVLAALAAAPAAQAGTEPYIGEMMLFAAPFSNQGQCPRYYMPADGRLLPISQYTPLFSLINTVYGGDGHTTFALPDLRGRVPIGQGTGPGLTSKTVGQMGGAESVTLTAQNLPAHSHTLFATTDPATHAAPAAGRLPAQAQNAGVYASTGGATVQMTGTGLAGSSLPFSVRNPYVVMNWCIAVEGVYPSQN